VTASGGTGTGLTVDVAAGGGGYININAISINTPGSGYTNGDVVTINNENNLPGTFIIVVTGINSWEFDINGDLIFPDSTIQSTAFIPTTFVTTSSFNEYTASHSTSSLVDRLNTLESETGSYLTNLNGTISGSSQLTSSFDERYVLSGSITTTPAGTISGSSQLTSSYDSRYVISGSIGAVPLGTISGSSQLTSSFDGRYIQTGSFNTLSSSVDNRLDTLEATIISGSPNYTQVLGNRRTGITSVNTSIISGSITTNGNPVQIMVTGDANPIGGAAWARLQIYRDGSAIGNIVQVENSSNLNVPYCLNVIDTPSAGTYVYSMRLVDSMSGTFDFGEASGPTLTAVELRTNTSFPSGTISGSSQLTSSFDTRYTLSGSVQPLPSNLISGSSQLTSSYDTRYAPSASYLTNLNGAISSSSQVLGGSGIYSSSAQLPTGIISGSSQLTASYDTRYTLSGSVVS
jgi:hypothetical protein